MSSRVFSPAVPFLGGCLCPLSSWEMGRGHCAQPPPPGLGDPVGEGRVGGRGTRQTFGSALCGEFSPLLVPAKMTGVATPRLLPGPAAPGREVLPWLRKRRPFRKTSSCRVQSGGTGGARAAGRDENRLGGSWMDARATLFWGDIGVPQRHLGTPRTLRPSGPLLPPPLNPFSGSASQPHQSPALRRVCPHVPPPVPTLMWKDDREMLGLPVVQRKRSC